MDNQGYVIPTMWYHTLVLDSGRPYMLAIAIMSDIFAGYKIEEKRDDTSGDVIVFEKGLNETLKRSYVYFNEIFWENEKNIQRALAFLENKGLIHRSFRFVKGADGRFRDNVLLIDINLEEIYNITYPSPAPQRKIKEKSRRKEGEKRGGQGRTAGNILITERSGHQCPRCSRCLLCSNEKVKAEDMDIESVELVLQQLIDNVYDEE